MSCPAWKKLWVAIAFLVCSLKTAKHWYSYRHSADIGAEKGSSQCQACLDAGQDFCIAENKCITRATFQCHGPYDHITGDKEFALHGNPDGIQHSMVCPEPTQIQDCYFDKECHAKVNWDTIARVKEGFFKRLEIMKEKKDASKLKEMLARTHQIFLEAGMPDDRIDYILDKWVKGFDAQSKETDKKDCYFDKECHAKVNWEKITSIKEGYFKRLKFFKENDDVDAVKAMMVKTHQLFLEAGMPDDRIDYILEKWAKAVYPTAFEASKEMDKKDRYFDEKDCYFDKQCHAKVDWEKITKIKEGYFKRLEIMKAKHDAGAVKVMMVKTHQLFLEAGMPDDRIDYILEKWVKYVYPGAFQARGEKEVDEKECFFDKECHVKVNWKPIGELKGKFFARLEAMGEKRDPETVKELIREVHPICVQAGMPEDRVDYMLEKWVKYADTHSLNVDKKDCYFDKECHAKVDWEKVAEVKNGFFARLKYYKEKNDVKAVKEMMCKVWGIFKEAGMPEDRIDYILKKWVKSTYPEALDADDKTAEMIVV